jgi:hypothetical protein
MTTLTLDIRIRPLTQKVLYKILIPFVSGKLKKRHKFELACIELINEGIPRVVEHNKDTFELSIGFRSLVNPVSKVMAFESIFGDGLPKMLFKLFLNIPPHLVRLFLLLTQFPSDILNGCHKISQGDNEKQ